MKSIGIVRNLDQLGRITLPMELRRTLNINVSDSVEIYTEGEAIVMKKYNQQGFCCKCGEHKNSMTTVDGVSICNDCLMQFMDKLEG